ncbi:MAG: pyruvate synthase subunit beta [Archaeoglobus sp.]|nr:MAG: pyruvate synthase subunit beta [Archaeoglobus sp.]
MEVKESILLSGNPSCQGCPHSLGLRALGLALDDPVVIIPAGCSTIVAGIHPKATINAPVLHVPFASAPAVASGIASAFRREGKKKQIVVWMGDGGADIGFATISGAAVRNEDIIVIVSDNEAYMNTGIQSSGTTFWKAKTTTSPTGKSEERKDLAAIMLMHRVPYVATASVGYLPDFINKLEKAKKIRGFRFIQLHSPCPPGWRFDSSKTVEIARMAVKCGAWILWEFDGKLSFSPASRPYKDKMKRTGLTEYLRAQGRFKGIDDSDIETIEKNIDMQWKFLEAFENF